MADLEAPKGSYCTIEMFGIDTSVHLRGDHYPTRRPGTENQIYLRLFYVFVVYAHQRTHSLHVTITELTVYGYTATSTHGGV